MTTLSEIGEKKLLQRLKPFISAGGRYVRLFSEDCAVIDTGAPAYQLITIDTLVEGVHFRREYVPPEFLGRKLYRINASDIAAMGGKPLYFLVTAGMPDDTPVSFLEDVYHSMTGAAREHSVDLIGGNVTSSPVLFFDCVLIGEVDRELVLLRNGAREGDTIFVTGPLGASSEGLQILVDGQRLTDAWGNDAQSAAARAAILAHLDPPDLLNLARKLAGLKMLSSMIDLSDGLASDLAEICRESNVGAIVDATQIPVAGPVIFWETRRQKDPLQLAISGGEDYHLLFTVRRDSLPSFLEHARSEQLNVIQIGQIVEAGKGIHLLRDGRTIPMGQSFEHFRKG